MSAFYQGKRVLVTGGTGFVGRHLVEELLLHGAHVRIPVHRRPWRGTTENVELVSADLECIEDCLAVVDDMDCVFHAAGSVGAAGIGPLGVMGSLSTNLILTARVLQAAWQAEVPRILIFSSSTIYPAIDHPVREEEAWTAPPAPSYFGYGWMRRYLEQISQYVAQNSSTKVALARPTAVYGRYDNFDLATCHVIPALVRRALERQDPFEVWGTGAEVRDFMHASDLARGCLLLLEKHACCDPVNLGYGDGFTIAEVVRIILKAARHNKVQVVFNTSRPTALPFRMVDTAKASKELGFSPKIPLDEGIADTVDWCRTEMGLS